MSAMWPLGGRRGSGQLRLMDAVVTGGGSGIGRGFCLELARRGGRVVVADIDEAAAKETAELVEALSGRGHAMCCDVSNLQDVEALARSAEQWFGAPTGLLVNNAGIGVGGQVVGQGRTSDWERTIAVNLWGVIHGCEVFVPRMRQAGRGGIINIASVESFLPVPGMAAYNVSKAGVLALSETLAAELSGTNVIVSVVCPAFVKTNILHPETIDAALLPLAEAAMARFGWTAEQVASVCLNAHERGRLHLLPQRDARLMWLGKRLAPATFTRAIGRLGRLMPSAVPPLGPPPGPTASALVAATQRSRNPEAPTPVYGGGGETSKEV